MKSTIEELGPTRVRMAIEVPWGDLDHAFGEVYKELGQQVRVPGFRPGKVPNRVLDDLLEHDGAADALVEDAVGDLAGTEAGHAHLLAELLVDLAEGVVQVPPGHLDRHPDPRGAEFLDGALHSGSAPWIADRQAPTGMDDAELLPSLETASNGRGGGI